MENAASNMDLMKVIVRGGHIGHRYGVLVHIANHYYTEPHRAYHGWNHIVEGAKFALDLAEKSDEFVLDLAQQLAWLFHDVVYIPGAPSGRNEYASVDMLDLFFRTNSDMLSSKLREEFSQEVVEKAKRIILATVHHSPGNLDRMPICDLDLLGFHDRELFERNNRLLSDEFALSAQTFELGQVRFLRQMLDRSHIYSTKYARENWEESARLNISRYIAQITDKYSDLLAKAPQSL